MPPRGAGPNELPDASDLPLRSAPTSAQSRPLIYIPECAFGPDGPPRVRWRRFEMPAVTNVRETVGHFLRRHLGILDIDLRGKLKAELATSRLQDTGRKAALGSAYGLELCPGDAEIAARIVSTETDIHGHLLWRPGSRSAWIIENGSAELPEATPGDRRTAYLDLSVPLDAISAVTGKLDERVDQWELDRALNQNLFNGPVALIPSCDGYFVKAQLPTLQREDNGAQELASDESLWLFAAGSMSLATFPERARNLAVRMLTSAREGDGTAYREPFFVQSDEVEIAGKSVGTKRTLREAIESSTLGVGLPPFRLATRIQEIVAALRRMGTPREGSADVDTFEVEVHGVGPVKLKPKFEAIVA